MMKTRFILLVVLYSCGVLADEIFDCPPESSRIEFQNPATKSKHISCVYAKEGQTVKHGKQWEFNSAGKLTRSTHYTHGKQIPIFEAVNLPGVEEATSKFQNSLSKKED
jgi:hypothetical protein